MKKILLAFVVAATFVACDNNKTSTTEATKDSVEAKKDMIDSTAEVKKDMIDSSAEAKKKMVDSAAKK